MSQNPEPHSLMFLCFLTLTAPASSSLQSLFDSERTWWLVLCYGIHSFRIYIPQKVSLKNISNNLSKTFQNNVELQHVKFLEICNPDYLLLKTTSFLDLDILSKSNIMDSML